MRIAHFSDLHLRGTTKVALMRIATNKRLTGYLNFVVRRARHHSTDAFAAMLDDIATQNIDHVVITGDLTNLSLDSEFEAVSTLLHSTSCLSPDRVTIVPGNHDQYTKGAYRNRRFERHFQRYLQSDLNTADTTFPIVRLRGPLAILGLTTAVPRPLLIAAGHVGDDQLATFAQVIGSEAVRGKTLIVLTHHPLIYRASALKTFRNGLRNASAVLTVLSNAPRVLALHGHLHRRVVHRLPTRAGELWSIGAASATLIHGGAHQVAGYNVYDFGSSGEIAAMNARVYDPATHVFAWHPLLESPA